MQSFLQKILPPWLIPPDLRLHFYRSYLSISLEDAFFLLVGFLISVAVNLCHIVLSRPFRHYVLLTLVLLLYLQKFPFG